MGLTSPSYELMCPSCGRGQILVTHLDSISRHKRYLYSCLRCGRKSFVKTTFKKERILKTKHWRKKGEEMSLKELEKAIKNQPDPVTGALGYVFDGDQIEEWIKRIEVEFDAFKKQLEERLIELQSRYDTLMIPSKEGPILRKQIDFIKRCLRIQNE